MTKPSPLGRKVKSLQQRLADAEGAAKTLQEHAVLAHRVVAEQQRLLVHAASLLRTAADQFEVRGAQPTAAHYRVEADRLDPCNSGGGAIATGAAALHELEGLLPAARAAARG